MKRFRQVVLRLAICIIGSCMLYLGWSEIAWRTGIPLPGTPYSNCGITKPRIPETVRIGLYEEFPVQWRLDKLKMIDFPVTLAIAASSREKFEELRAHIKSAYPQVQEVYFWPLLSDKEGYYPGSWSQSAAVARVANEAAGVPVLWDLEFPPKWRDDFSLREWRQNSSYLTGWLSGRKEAVHIWRSYPQLGLDPLLLRLLSMHYDPGEFQEVTLHLDLYSPNADIPASHLYRVMRCGVERYGPRFIPSLGVLNDGEGSGTFISRQRLMQNVQSARSAGASEIWLFGLNGITPEIVANLHEIVPLDTVQVLMYLMTR